MNATIESSAPPIRSFEALAPNPGWALTYLIVTSGDPEGQTTAEIGRRLGMLQGANPGWRPEKGSMEALPRAYCTGVLQPSGLVVAKKLGSRGVLGFAPNPDIDPAEHIARAASTLDWELQTPSHRLSDTLGDTRISYKRSLSLNAMSTYEHLLTASGGKASHLELEEATGCSKATVQRTLKFLIEAGTIDKFSKANLGDRLIELIETEPNYLRAHGSQMGPALTALYATTRALRRQGRKAVDGATLVQEVNDRYPLLDIKAIRHALTRSPSPQFIAFVDGDRYGKDNTAYSIKPAFRPAIADLALRLKLVQSDAQFVEDAVARAKDILLCSEDVAFLMSKAHLQKEWSPKRVDGQTQTRRALASLTLQPLVIAQGWENQARCRAVDGDLFFPIGTSGPSLQQTERAKQVCAACPAVTSCLQWSLDTQQKEGVFGGKTPDERRAYRQKPHVKELQLSGAR